MVCRWKSYKRLAGRRSFVRISGIEVPVGETAETAVGSSPVLRTGEGADFGLRGVWRVRLGPRVRPADDGTETR